MLETLNNWDINLLTFLNSLNCEYLDKVFWLFSQKLTWVPMYLALIVALFLKDKKQAIFILVLTALLITIADQMSSGLIKPLVERLRPSHNPLIADTLHIINNYRGGQYGFVSSHAANTVAFAVFFSLVFRNKAFTWISIIWAATVSYSRIYLGVHYPGDILGGTIVGIFAAYTTFFIYNRLAHIKWLENACDRQFSINHAKIAYLAILLNVLAIMAISTFMQ